MAGANRHRFNWLSNGLNIWLLL